MNLALNARDAMPQGGKLMVGTGHVTLEGESARSSGVGPGEYVIFSVSDTGHGMDAETRGRMFEPFFTTKASGGGTGLGSSAVQGIVEQSGGHIEVFSEIDRGTMIRILLPDLDDTRARELDAEETRPAWEGASEAHAIGSMDRPAAGTMSPPAAPGAIKILLVEDEAMVRRMVSSVLHRVGYQVSEAEGGEEALAFSAQHPDTVTLLITDVMMPWMQGSELARRLAPQQADMRVIYMSGFTDDRTLLEALPRRGAGFLAKPFTPQALLDKIASVLEIAVSEAV